MCGHSLGGGSGGQRGAASVELIATLPFLGLALLVAIQFALAGASLWAASISARAGARAVEVGGKAGAAGLGPRPRFGEDRGRPGDRALAATLAAWIPLRSAGAGLLGLGPAAALSAGRDIARNRVLLVTAAGGAGGSDALAA